MGVFIPIAIILGIILIYVYSNINENRNIKALLTTSFGKPPEERDYEMASIKRYHNYINDPPMNLSVDDITWNDLDMDRIFKRINACQTSVGEEYLYASLHRPHFEPSALLAREEFIQYLSAHPSERLALQFQLAKTGRANYNGLASIIFRTDEKKWTGLWIYNTLALIPLAGLGLLFFNSYLGFAVIFLSFVTNLIVSYATRRKTDREAASFRYLASVLRGCGQLCKIEALSAFQLMKELNDIYRIFKPLTGRVPAAKSIVDSGNMADILLEYLRILVLYDIRNFIKFKTKIDQSRNELHALYRSYGEIDMAVSVLSFRVSLPFFAAPAFHTERAVHFKDIYHPLITGPVLNSGVLGNDSLITGSNASGKSTFIKALAINGILAQTIYTCTAKNYGVRFSLTLTSMALRDNLDEGESYFVVEIKSLKRILDLMRAHPCTCYIDEILRGTNNVERIAASAAVLEYIHKQDSLCVVASHDIELTSLLAGRLDNYHFREQVLDNGISFDYKLREGAATTTNAIRLLDYLNFDTEITQKAQRLADGFIRDNTWPALGE